MIRYFLSAALLISSATAMAAPVISSIAGTVADNQEVTVTGSGFGANALRQEFVGGQRLDSLADGARFDQLGWANWSLMTPSTSLRPHVSTERGWSNGKSMVFDTRGTTEYKQTMFYDTGATGFSTLYTNALIYLDHNDLMSGSYLQWKMMRWYKVADVVDHLNNLSGSYMSNRLASTSFFSTFNSGGQVTNWFDTAPTRNNLPGRRAWYRYETWLRMNSAPGTGNGYFRVRVTNPVSGAVVVDNIVTNGMFNASGDVGNYRYLVLQNYYGNASDGGYSQADNAQAVSWWDDIYISQSEARVEVCDQATYAACVNKEIQYPTSWADGSITVRLNKGNKSTVGSFLYIVDSTGAVNANGYRLAATVRASPATSVTVN